MNEIFWYYDGRNWIKKHGAIGMYLAKKLGYLVAIAKGK